jgi:signal transduction histidine kinase
VTVDAAIERLPGAVESAAYFVASEALANVAKYAHATRATVAVSHTGRLVVVDVADDGIGGADATRGSGLRGLADRVAALDGTIAVDSPAGRGTRLRAEIPWPTT